MTLRINPGEPGWFERFREASVGLGLVALVAGLVSGAVLGGVALLHAARDRGPRAAPMPVVPRPIPPAARLEPPGPVGSPAPSSERTAVSAVPPGPDIPSIDEEGFVRHWLILGPFPFERAQPGGVELARQQIRENGKLRPRAGMKVSWGGTDLTWFPHRSPDFYIDFRVLLGKIRGEEATAYAACYLLAEREIRGARLRMGSNDQAKVLLNGREVLQFSETRTLQKDQNVSEEVELHAGTNIILFKVVNEKQNWQGCLRLTDSSGAPLRGIRLALSPP